MYTARVDAQAQTLVVTRATIDNFMKRPSKVALRSVARFRTPPSAVAVTSHNTNNFGGYLEFGKA